MTRQWQKTRLRFWGRLRNLSDSPHRRLAVESLEDRSLLSAAPYTPIDLGGTFDRIAAVQIYQGTQWALSGQSTANVGQALANFHPTEVSGLIRFQQGDTLTEQQIADYSAIRSAVLAVDPQCKFDFQIDASTITGDGTAAIATMQAVETALQPDLWFFSLYSQAYQSNPKGLASVVAWAHAQGEAVGGDVTNTTAPPNSDYAAVNDHFIRPASATGGLSAAEINVIEADTNFTRPLPVIAHLNDAAPADSGLSEPQVFINPTGSAGFWNQSMRIQYVTSLAQSQAAWRYSLMYPVFSPASYDSTADLTANRSTTTYAQMEQLAGTYNALGLTATTTTVSASPNPSFAAAPVVITATVTAGGSGTPGGNVLFFDGATALGYSKLDDSGQATLTTKKLAAGNQNLFAVYEGKGALHASDSTAYAQTVLPVVTTATHITGPTQAAFGQAVSLVALAVPATGTALTTPVFVPAGTMTFKEGKTVLGTIALDAHGAATLSGLRLPVGRHTITAIYGGDPGFTASTSFVFVLNVSKAGTQTTLATSAPTAHVGQTVTFTAQVATLAANSGVPTGTVSFWDGRRLLATVAVNASGIATLSTATLGLGTHRIHVVYNPTVNFVGSVSAILNENIVKA